MKRKDNAATTCVGVQNVGNGRHGFLLAWATMLTALLWVETVAAQGIFSQSGALGTNNLDTSVGLSSSKTYLNAVNINGGSGTLTINGVIFSNTTGLNPSGSTWSTSGLGAAFSGGDTIGGVLGTLLNTFNHNPNAPVGAVETFRLTGLTVGQTYVMTVYSKSYDSAGARLQDTTSSSGASLLPYDQGIGGKPNANLLRYTFTASNTAESVSFSQRAPFRHCPT